MNSKIKSVERSIITDNLVVEKTKKTMETWFILLDKRGAKNMEHSEIFNLVSSIDGLKSLGEWNQNLLTTSYEWSRGLKKRGQKADGYEIAVSKTIAVPVSVLYHAWIDPSLLNKWLKEDNILFRKKTENRSDRIIWVDKETSLSVDFYIKGENKSQVVVQHLKISGYEKSELLKLFWNERLDDLKLLLKQ